MKVLKEPQVVFFSFQFFKIKKNPELMVVIKIIYHSCPTRTHVGLRQKFHKFTSVFLASKVLHPVVTMQTIRHYLWTCQIQINLFNDAKVLVTMKDCQVHTCVMFRQTQGKWTMGNVTFILTIVPQPKTLLTQTMHWKPQLKIQNL